jgi:hypothetical protein
MENNSLNILFKEKIDSKIYYSFIIQPLDIILKRNNLIYLIFGQVFASIFGMFFFIYRKSIIYIYINSLTLTLSFCGLYGIITINSIFLLTHCVLTISFGGGFFLFQIFNDIFTVDSTYGDKKRISDHILLFIFSLPYLYDIFTGYYNYKWLKLINNKNNYNENLIHNENKDNKKVEMINLNDSNSNLCVICLNKEKNTAFEPCGHVCCCYNCAFELIKKNCPICRSFNNNIVRIYI